MPVYTYHCDNCQHEFDKQQGFSDPALKKCPACGKLQLHKVYRPAQVLFKGSGYYVTDSRGRSSTLAANGKSENGNGKSQGQGEAKAEAKPESRAEAKTESKSTPAAKPE